MSVSRLTLIGWGMSVVLAAAQTAAVAQDPSQLPEAKAVLARYVEVTGGAKKYAAVKTSVYEGTVSIPEAGVEGKITIYFQQPDKLFVNVELGEVLGSQQRGLNGKVAWEKSTIAGARLIEGEEAARMLESPGFRNILKPETVYASMQCTGLEVIDDQPCYKLELTRKNGDKDITYYSKDSGLTVLSVTNLPTPAGKLEIKTRTSEYRDVDGLKVPYKSQQKLPNGISQVLEFTSVKINIPIEEKIFALPPEVQKLVDAQK